MVSEEVDPQRVVFVEEMGANASLSPLRAWSRRGQRAYCSVPRNRGPNTTLLASMNVDGMGPALAVEGSITAAVFRALHLGCTRAEAAAGASRAYGQPSPRTRASASGSSSKRSYGLGATVPAVLTP
jgi:hypothetical protein